MKVTKETMDAAVRENILSASQAKALLEFLRSRPGAESRFNFTHALYYAGGLVAIGAVTIFMNLGWEKFGGWGMFCIAIAYAVIGLLLANGFHRRGYATPASLSATFVIAATPLAIYGLQEAMGWWPEDSAYREYIYHGFHDFIRWPWLYMELGALIVGLLMFWKYRYPFLLLPVAITLWYASIDLAVMMANIPADEFGDAYRLRADVSLGFGLIVILLAFWTDLRARKTADYAHWLYFAGVVAFWGGLTSQQSDSELAQFLYFCVNLLMVGAGVALARGVFVALGALGACLYLGRLAFEVFKDSWLFPVALAATGLSIIYLGMVWQRNEQAITRKARNCLPAPLRQLLADRAGLDDIKRPG